MPAPHDPMEDARLACSLFAIDPLVLGGLWLRGGGPARDELLDRLKAALGDMALKRMPVGIDDERLVGGIDISASLVAGRSIRQQGLLADAAGGVLVVPMAERLEAARAGRIAQAMDGETGFGLVLLDDSASADEAPPHALTERCALQVDLSQARTVTNAKLRLPPQRQSPRASADDMRQLSEMSSLLGVRSSRALVLALRAALAHAVLHNRRTVKDIDLEAAVRLVLAPRATQYPEAVSPEEPPQSREQEPSDAGSEERKRQLPDEMLLDAALAAIPPDLLALMEAGRTRRGNGSGGGQKKQSGLRGRPLTAQRGMPGGNARLALIDTLRAAAPWQPLRREAEHRGAEIRLRLRKDDLRVRRFEEGAGAVTIFAVDASGSSALARLAEAKGAVELMLADAYRKRAEVALIAFRCEGAEILLPPTRSLTRAKRALAELPGGGGTPLAAGIEEARRLAEAVKARGRTPFLVLMTDGKANVGLDGAGGRSQARVDADAAARRLFGANVAGVLVDISPRPAAQGAEIAAKAGLTYLPLPYADGAKVRDRVEASR